MIRVPFFNSYALPLCSFTTHDPDTGASVDADSLPTAVLRNVNSYASVATLLCVKVSDGHYVVRFNTSDTWQSVLNQIRYGAIIEVSATVGGITRKMSWLAEAGPPAFAGKVQSHLSSTELQVLLYPWGGNVTYTPDDGALVGSLLSTQDGQVRRIVGYESGVITLDSGIVNAPNHFWVVTI